MRRLYLWSENSVTNFSFYSDWIMISATNSYVFRLPWYLSDAIISTIIDSCHHLFLLAEGSWPGSKNIKARFKRRTLHVPNLIIRFVTCKVRRMNQLGTALLYLGQLFRSIRLSLSNRTAKDLIRFIRRTSHVPNLLHTLC